MSETVIVALLSLIGTSGTVCRRDSDLGDIMDEMLQVEKTENKINVINLQTASSTTYPTTEAVVEYVNQF